MNALANPPRKPTPGRQRGVLSLLMALVILTLITFVSLYTARTVTMEQRIAANVRGSQAAFEAAEGGMAQAMSYVNTVDVTSITECNMRFDDDGNHLPDRAGCAHVSVAVTDRNVKTYDNLDRSNLSRARVRLSPGGFEDGEPTRVTVTSIGATADGAAQRTIQRVVRVYRDSVVPNPPNTPLTARGSFTPAAGAEMSEIFIHNPEGNTTIRTGGNFIFSQTANTFIANPAHKADLGGTATDNYPACLGGANSCEDPDYSGLNGCAGEYSAKHTNFVKCGTVASSSGDNLGIDVDLFPGYAAVDANVFFENIFSLGKAAYRTVFVDREIDPADWSNNYDDSTSPGLKGDHSAIPDPIVDLALDLDEQPHGKVIWVTGDLEVTGSLVLGCVGKPAVGPVSVVYMSSRDNNDPAADRSAIAVENCAASGRSDFQHPADDPDEPRLSPVYPIVPVALIVDGDLEITGIARIFGLVYVMGDFISSGDTEIQGALVVEGSGANGDATYNTVGGELTLWYDSGILRQFIGEDLYTPIPGAWKDF